MGNCQVAATILFRALSAGKGLLESGERDAGMLRARMREILRTEMLVNEEYISVAHPETLDELDSVQGAALLSLAVKIGKTRLIDNFLVEGITVSAR